MTTTLPVGYYLKELNGEQPGRGRLGGMLGQDGASQADAQLRDAHARGILEGRAAAQAEYDAMMAAQAAKFEQKLAMERATWSQGEGERLAALMAGAAQEIEQRIAAQVSRVLKPIIIGKIGVQSVEELSKELGEIVSKGDFRAITISGPEDLLSAMRARFADQPGITFSADGGVDLSVRVDETILETRIGAWAAAVEGNGP